MKRKYIKLFLLFLFSFIFLFFIDLLFLGAKLDIYWNYNGSLQISNGLIPYKDISLLTTPLFHYIMSFFLHFFGKNIIVFTSIMTLLKLIHIWLLGKIVMLFCDIYKIKNKTKFFLITFTFGMMFIYNIYYEYNFLSLLFVNIITYIELRNNNSIKNNIIIGILSSLAFLSKQSIGLIVYIFILLEPLLFNKEKKQFILYRLIGILIPILIFIAYLLFTNSFNSFIDYAVLGVTTFKNNLSYIESLKNVKSIFKIILAMVLLISFIIFFIRQIYLLYKKRFDRNKKILLFYSIISLSCFYPLRDIHHLLPVLFMFVPLLVISLFDCKSINKFKVNNKHLKFVLNFFIICTLLTPLNMYINIYNDNDEFSVVLKDNYNSLNGVVVVRNLKANIDYIVEYEKNNDAKGIKTLFLNKTGVMFHLVQNKYYKNYDLFMKGNLGYNGQEEMIEEIKSSKNTVYLIHLEDKNVNPNTIQLPDKVFNYVIDNLNEVGQVLHYTVYSK